MIRTGKIAIVLFVFLVGFAQARTITVGPGPGYDFNSIQPAIDDSNDGDTIIVQPGLYLEVVRFNGTNVTVRSTNPENFDVVAKTIIEYGVGFAGTEEPNCNLTALELISGLTAGIRTQRLVIVCSSTAPTLTAQQFGGLMEQSVTA